MPNIQITMANHISASASQAALSIQELVTTMRASGMSNVAIKQTLLNDLNSGGQLFGTFRNKIKNTVKNGVEFSSNDSANGEFTKAGVQQFKWISVGDKKVCIDCEGRHGETGTMEFFETIGLPASGFSICTTNCRCQLVPENYKDENLDKPLVKKEMVKPKVIDFKMAGKHETVKDSLGWMQSNVAKSMNIRTLKDLDILNVATKGMSEILSEYNLDKLYKIGLIKGRSSAMANASARHLNFKTKYFNNKKALESVYTRSTLYYGESGKKLLKKSEKLLDKAIKEGNKATQRGLANAIFAIKARQKSKAFRHTVQIGEGYEAVVRSTVHHELGHVIHGQFSGGTQRNFRTNQFDGGPNIRAKGKRKLDLAKKMNIEWEDLYTKLKKDGDISRYISEYANTNHKELFAESFAMYVGGEKNKLPKSILEYLERYFKEFN